MPIVYVEVPTGIFCVGYNEDAEDFFNGLLPDQDLKVNGIPIVVIVQ
jgi:hypothetical protein